MTIIIPIFRLSGHRFNNFCFLIKQLKKIKVDILVCEQHSNLSVNIEKFLSQYKKVKYICKKTQFDYFNKSNIINLAFKTIDTKFGWVMDADFYADYNYIINQVETNYNHMDFIRPFSEVVLLDKAETESLYSINKILLYNNEYQINSEDGKYSFIVNRETFNNCGGFNEDFQGWGFQDLDFVQNRLPTESLRDNIKKQAFHLYHEVAEKKHAIYNRTLFENLGGSLTKRKSDRISSSMITETSFVNKTTIVHRERKNKITKYESVVDKHTSFTSPIDKPTSVWNRPSFGVVCVEFIEDVQLTNINVKKSIIKEETKLVYSNLGMQKTKIRNGCLLYYIKYIIKKYEQMSPNQSVVFANNMFSSKQVDMNNLDKKLEEVNTQRLSETDSEFQWLFPNKTNFKRNKQKTTSGCFIIKTNLILKKSKDEYVGLKNKLTDMKFSEQTKALEDIHSFFV